MSLVKTSLLSALAVVARLLSSLVLNKILAIYVGPAGYAVIGQFQNAISVVVNLAGGMFVSGVTKATAQHYDVAARQHVIWQTAIRLSLLASLFAGISLLFLGNFLASWILHQPEMSSVFIWLALSLPAMVVNNLLLSIVNGKKEVGIYVTANIFGSLLSMLQTGALAYFFGLFGALVAYAVNPAVVLLATASMVIRREWFNVRDLWGKINRPALRELSRFGLMGLTTALTVPISYMLIRDHLATNLGLAAAGYWQASWRISEIYLMLITSTLSVYYLPRLSEIKTASELINEIFKVYRYVMPLVIVGALIIYFLRDFIIQTLFTAYFLPMRELFPWQLAGDVIKIGSWVLAFVMLGRAMTKVFVVTEIVFAISFFLLSWMLVDAVGLKGVAMAYAVNYTLYWLTMWYLIRIEIREMQAGK